MRLTILDNGHRARVTWFFTMTRLMSGVDASDVPKTLLYRPAFFGSEFLRLSAEAMRGPSYWTAGEREYLAKSTAEWHRCPYCVEAHAELTRIASDGEIDPADPGSVRPEPAAVLRFAEKASLTPGGLTAGDADEVRAAGVPDAAIVEALRVNLIWNVVNRLANAFGFELRPGQLETGTRALHRYKYRFPGFLTGRAGPGDPVDGLRRRVFESPARMAPALRAAAGNGGSLPEVWDGYAAKVRDESFRVTDADVEKLKAAGQGEDEIFEMTVAAAVGAALRSFDAGMAAVDGGDARAT